MSDPQRATTLGATGGLPGANASPAAREPTRDELDVVQSGDLPTTPIASAADQDASEQDASGRAGRLSGEEPG